MLHAESVCTEIGTDFIQKERLNRNMRPKGRTKHLSIPVGLPKCFVRPKGLTKHLGGPTGMLRCFVRPLGRTFLSNLSFWIKSVPISGHTDSACSIICEQIQVNVCHPEIMNA